MGVGQPAISAPGIGVSAQRSRGVAIAIVNAQRWTTYVAAILIPLTVWPLTYDHYVLPKLLAARLVVLVLAFLFIARVVITGSVQIKRTPLDLPLLAFVWSAALSTIFSVNANVALFGTYSRYDGLLTLVTYAALFWLVVHSLRHEQDTTALLRSILIGAYIVSVVAIVRWCADALTGQPDPRAYGTLGNANVLGAYLVLLIPAAYADLRQATSTAARLLSANALITLTLALLLSVSHSAWLGLAVAAAVLLVGRQVPLPRSLPRLALMVVGAAALIAAVAPIALSRGTDIAQRLHIWSDSIALIASRPLLGYGPDTFGLVYPGFQTGQWVLGYAQIDKAHSELLQVAATQGLVGLATWIWLMAAFVVAFWRGRRQPAAWALFAGWAAYQAVLLVNFTALSAAFPFWIFAAAAVTRWQGERAHTSLSAPSLTLPTRWGGKITRIAGLAVVAGLIALAVPPVINTYLADQLLKTSVDAYVTGQPRPLAEQPAQQAHQLAPWEPVYDTELGNIAYQYEDLEAARTAYGDAVALGTFDPRVYRNLAVVDLRLGRTDEALIAARHAVFLDRFDPINQAVLAQAISETP